MLNIVTTRFQGLLKSGRQFLAAREAIGGCPQSPCHERVQSLPSDHQLPNPIILSKNTLPQRGRICKSPPTSPGIAKISPLGCSHWPCLALLFHLLELLLGSHLSRGAKHGWSLKIWWHPWKKCENMGMSTLHAPFWVSKWCFPTGS